MTCSRVFIRFYHWITCIANVKYIMKGNRVEFQYQGHLKSFRVIEIKNDNVEVERFYIFSIIRDTIVIISPKVIKFFFGLNSFSKEYPHNLIKNSNANRKNNEIRKIKNQKKFRFRTNTNN